MKDKKGSLLKNRNFLVILVIFLLALAIRFLYFPGNIYFGFDQARDAYISQEILRGEFKIVGPTTSTVGLNHGALFYYLYAPLYFLFQGDPSGLAIFIRVYNALGVILIYFLAKNLFSKQKYASLIGIVAAILFAVSYEQSQYSLFMTHPTFVVITSILFYFGMTLLIFKGRAIGLPLALLGAGMSFQFHFLQAYLFIIFALYLIIFRKRIPRINLKFIGLSILALLLSLSTYIAAEIRFKFQGVSNLLGAVTGNSETGSNYGFFYNNAFSSGLRFISDNLFFYPGLQIIILLILILACALYLKQKETRGQIIFLLVWIVVGLMFYFIEDKSLYFYAVGTSISLLVLVAFLIIKVFERFKLAAIVILFAIISSNFYLITVNNAGGPNKEINVQTGMLLGKQKQVIDFIYQKAEGDEFAVNAYTMPLFINTTWDYLFENYGKSKYGYAPVWGGKAAAGYPGVLTINNSRTTLPKKRFLIIEPTRDSVDHLKDFETEEGYFAKIVEERRFGDIIVYVQEPI